MPQARPLLSRTLGYFESEILGKKLILYAEADCRTLLINKFNHQKYTENLGSVSQEVSFIYIFETLQEKTEKSTPNDEYENFVNAHLEAAAKYIPTKLNIESHGKL